VAADPQAPGQRREPWEPGGHAAGVRASCDPRTRDAAAPGQPALDRHAHLPAPGNQKWSVHSTVWVKDCINCS